MFHARFCPQFSLSLIVFEIYNLKNTPNVELLCYLFQYYRMLNTLFFTDYSFSKECLEGIFKLQLCVTISRVSGKNTMVLPFSC